MAEKAEKGRNRSNTRSARAHGSRALSLCFCLFVPHSPYSTCKARNRKLFNALKMGAASACAALVEAVVVIGTAAFTEQRKKSALFSSTYVARKQTHAGPLHSKVLWANRNGSLRRAPWLPPMAVKEFLQRERRGESIKALGFTQSHGEKLACSNAVEDVL